MAKQYNIVVLISGGGSNLQSLIDHIESGDIKANISCVISNIDGVHGLTRAEKAGIATRVISHKDFESRNAFDSELANIISSYSPDLVVLAGFMRILTEGFVEQFENRLINIHPSLLPKFTGLNTHQRAIDAKESAHGASVHFVIPELDAGPIIIQGEVPVQADDTAQTLQQRVLKAEHHIYPLAVKWLSEGKISVKADKVLLDGHESELQRTRIEC